MVKEGGGDREIRGRKKEKESKWELFEKRKKIKKYGLFHREKS